MPTKTWEPARRQPDPGGQPAPPRSDEPRNFETGRGERGVNPDAPSEVQRFYAGDDGINTHGSER